MTEAQSRIREKAAQVGRWKRIGPHAWVCGKLSVTNFHVCGNEKWALYQEYALIGKYDSREAAMQAAKEIKSA